MSEGASLSHKRARALIGAIALAACASSFAHAGADDVAAGRELAERLCADCHMNVGQGEKEGRAGIPGFIAVANRQGQSMESIVGWLKSAPPMMPNHHLSQDEMFRLAAFILSLRKGE
jgi:mono/diheme cytochrome c family protein